ncbi:MAG: DNA polymerase III subunit gamma/tau [Clostridia bacterium]|nr:DNA polymerase III subunit gamma/tau [Clostridia bacterium]
MAYKALYRKWRPDTFDSVIGQNHITETLRNEILTGRLAHAYLFTGTRGTGKTSTAKILSRAVNCTDLQNGNPCNKCECCTKIANELSLDVMEIDAASNTGVDNIRDIIEQLNYLPSMGKYKVYIIDEVHMLSQGAFNALLKTLEEPPSHVLFILATTEVQKIPATILSRCQRFDFKTISVYDIVENLKKILEAEGISADDDALEYVAFLGDGSMRDSLSILDQCLAFKNNDVSLSDVTDIVGAIDDAVLYEFAADIAKSDVSSALTRFNNCVNSGKNFDNIMNGLMQTMREILMFKINADEYTVSKLKRKYLSECAHLFDINSLVRYIGILNDCIRSFKSFSSQRVLCECALISLTTPMVNTDSDSLLSRISAIENRLNCLEKNPPVQINAEENPKHKIPEEMYPLPEPPEDDVPPAPQSPADLGLETSKAPKGDEAKVIANWNDIMASISASGKFRIFTALFGIKPQFNEGTLVLCVADNEKKRLLTESVEFIKESIKSAVGVQTEISITSDIPDMSSNASGEDVFSNLGNIRKNFPANIRID